MGINLFIRIKMSVTVLGVRVILVGFLLVDFAVLRPDDLHPVTGVTGVLVKGQGALQLELFNVCGIQPPDIVGALKANFFQTLHITLKTVLFEEESKSPFGVPDHCRICA